MTDVISTTFKPAGPKTLPLVKTAAEAFHRYRQLRSEGRIIQNGWHNTDERGRIIACGLGVLGKSVESPDACPAKVMPRWLAQFVPGFFDNMELADALAWGDAFYEQLARLGGEVPFSVVHDWRANVCCPLNMAFCEKRGHDTGPEKAVQALHFRALAGDLAPEDDWKAALATGLKTALPGLSASASAYASAYASASASASASAYASASASAYASASASASASAYASASASASADERRDAIKRMAFGMVECLSRVPV